MKEINVRGKALKVSLSLSATSSSAGNEVLRFESEAKKEMGECEITGEMGGPINCAHFNVVIALEKEEQFYRFLRNFCKKRKIKISI